MKRSMTQRDISLSMDKNCGIGSATFIAPKEHLRLTGMVFVRTSRWNNLFTQYLVVELSLKAEIWCMFVASSNDDVRILTFLGINNNRDFQNSRFFCGDLTVLSSEWH